MSDFSWSPLHSFRQLDDGNARGSDQLAILGHAVRNGNAVAQIGVRLTFPPDHAFDIAGFDEARFDKDLTCGANGFVLTCGASTNPDVLRRELNHESSSLVEDSFRSCDQASAGIGSVIGRLRKKSTPAVTIVPAMIAIP